MLLVQTDREYNTVDFDDPVATLTYFKKLCASVFVSSTDEMDQHFDTLSGLMDAAEVCITGDQAHGIMRTAAENVHNSFQRLKHGELGATVQSVLLETTHAFFALHTLSLDSFARKHEQLTKLRDSTRSSGAVSENEEPQSQEPW